jgi:diaminohydroxyphosphoribosylaminopyrimidine deaminase/5-amino-6-(5-phosphoribosylamino)uracil reductase
MAQRRRGPSLNTAGSDDYAWMARALRLAERGLYGCNPNPRVGCVIVREGHLVGEGWHERQGGPHAETSALERAGASAEGATAYITLEPCNHHGRTPPCSQALAEAGVSRVVVAASDPNPLAGGGSAHLRDVGVEVVEGVARGEAEALNPGFFKRHREGMPWLRLKLAASLDGRTAMASGESQWISDDAARADVHRWRSRSSAILTGSGTVVADDPQLTARGPEAVRQPHRCVLDSGLVTPTDARMVTDGGGVTLFCSWPDEARQQPLEAAGATVAALPPAAGGGVDPVAALAALARDEANEVLAECGPTLGGALVQAGVVDELIVYLAPHLMGDEARPLLRLPGLEQMSERLALEIRELRTVGEAIRIRARPAGASGED